MAPSGGVSAAADPSAAIALAWQHILDNIHLALLMAVAIALLASLAIAHTLAPAQISAWMGVVFAAVMMGGLGRPIGPLVADLTVGDRDPQGG